MLPQTGHRRGWPPPARWRTWLMNGQRRPRCSRQSTAQQPMARRFVHAFRRVQEVCTAGSGPARHSRQDLRRHELGPPRRGDMLAAPAHVERASASDGTARDIGYTTWGIGILILMGCTNTDHATTGRVSFTGAAHGSLYRGRASCHGRPEARQSALLSLEFGTGRSKEPWLWHFKTTPYRYRLAELESLERGGLSIRAANF
jgi:hypothetical protein